MLALLVVASLACGLEPVADDPAPPRRPWGLNQVGYDVRHLARRPASIDRREAWTLAAVAGTAALLFVAREEIRDHVLEHRSEERSQVLDVARTMGKGAFAPALALVALTASAATHQDRERETALLLLESMGASAFAALAGSAILASERPPGTDVEFLSTDGHGVSLDAALAASVIPPLRRQYLRVREGDGTGRRFAKRAATGLLYTGAVLTAFQRVDSDAHWAPDAFLGTMTGLAVGQALARAHDDAAAARAGARLTMTPAGPALVVRVRPRRGRPF